jgi:threonine dehydratase
MNKPCVQTRVVMRRMSRHPIVQQTIRTGSRIQKHAVRSATLSLVPDAVNDIAFHHAQMNMDEVVHVFQDTIAISTMNMVLATMLVLSKFV